MFTYSKLAQGAIAAVSYLAAVSAENRLAGSGEIADDRQLSRKQVAKILTMLSAAGIVHGKPGPAGGYELTRTADQISLLDVVRIFENLEERVMCPFGPKWCGVKPNCPLHETFMEMHQKTLDRLQKETFQQFIGYEPLASEQAINKLAG